MKIQKRVETTLDVQLEGDEQFQQQKRFGQLLGRAGRLVVTLHDGGLSGAKVLGRRVLKDGTLGDGLEMGNWWTTRSGELADAPPAVAAAVAAALAAHEADES